MDDSISYVLAISLWILYAIQTSDIQLLSEIEPYHSDFLKVSDMGFHKSVRQ